jgi:hypothetical protein
VAQDRLEAGWAAQGARQAASNHTHRPAQLRSEKILLAMRTDLQLDAAAVLYGNDYLDRQQFDALGRIIELFQRAARARGGKDAA